MSYIDTLNQTQRNNAATLVVRMEARGIHNEYSKAAVLAIVSKESAFIPHPESSYRNTPNDRIRAIFGRLKSYTDDALNLLKSDDRAFFNTVYGGLYGNGPSQGFSYRGGGYHQLTFLANYKAQGERIGIDLVAHPERINEPEVAADELCEFFKAKFVEGARLGVLAQYNTADINGFKNTTDAVNCVYHSNAGWGKSRAAIDADPTGGKAKAISRVNDLLSFVRNHH